MADVSPLAAVLLVTGAIVLVGGLILIGVRQRPELEIPPRRWPQPLPMPPRQRRLYLGLVIAGWGCWLVALMAAVLEIRWLVLLGWSLFVAIYVIRISMTLHRALRARRRARMSRAAH